MKTFVIGWKETNTPVMASVEVSEKNDEYIRLDHSIPLVGLMAMQMYALGVEKGSIVQLTSKNGNKCQAHVWNANGIYTNKKINSVTLNSSATKKLRCKDGDEIVFSKIVAGQLPPREGLKSKRHPAQKLKKSRSHLKRSS